ncbi:MAG TPA: DUF1269 domain-containing protein [Bryobacteraceae bacterium]|nr:DUF1269 domain-containing protein [Bryobacteraceae bacterium]
MLAVIFDDENKAYEGSRALAELDREGKVSVHAKAVVKRSADGTVYIPHAETDFPLRTLTGTAIGGLVGLLGGAAGVEVGAAVGSAVGVFADICRTGVNDEFLTSVLHSLSPGKSALLADISEEWVTPVDVRMEALGGVVYRTTREHAKQEQLASEQAEIRTELDRLKTEFAETRADTKAELRARIDKLKAHLKARLDQIRQEHEIKEAKLKDVLAYAHEQLVIHEREIQGIRILDLHGHIIAGASEARLRERITALTESGAVNVILNCDRVMDIDVDGLTSLAWCSAMIRYSGGALKLLKVRWDHMDLIARAGLDKEFEIFSDEGSALNSFFPERAVPTFDVLEYAKQQRKEASDRVT